MEKKDIASYSYEELEREVELLGEKRFRAKQIYTWLHKDLADSFEEMTNLSKSLRERLDQQYDIKKVSLVMKQVSAVDPTEKYLFELQDGNRIESVLMKYSYGNSVCISSQAGCRMGCRFCASTIDGLARNLTASEMLRQVYMIQKLTKERVSNIVVMGTGEPLDNYENLLRFLHMVTDEDGLHISQRNVTVSTCGIVPKMRMLADENLQITLALSLHAPTQEKRSMLMPIAGTYALEEVLEACRYYFYKTGRRVTFEYSLSSGVNDSDEEAKQLIRLLRSIDAKCHVNLIPVNPVRERDFRQPNRQSVLQFQKKLLESGINATIRREMGQDIDGACGQLRRKYAAGTGEP